MTIHPMQSAHDAPRCKANRNEQVSPACGTAIAFVECMGAGGGAPTGKQNGNYGHGTRTRRRSKQ